MLYKYKHYLVLVLLLNISFHGLTQTYMLVDSTVTENVETINIAYGSQPARDVSSAVSTVSGEELRRSFVPNLANTLYGRLPGLMVVQRGNEPGNDSPGLLLRGLNTFGEAGNAPLIIVDGIESSFEQLTPYEIESITLLKDAAATAIYGGRGANGVLLITTKRGIEGELKINLSAQVGFQQATRMPEFLNAYDYGRLYNEGLVNDGQSPAYSNAALEKYRNGSDPFLYPSVNWYDEILRSSAPISNYNLNFRGGDKSVRYFASLNALSNGGLYQKTGDLSENSLNAKYSRYNVRANLDIQLSKRISTSLDIGGSIEEKHTPSANTTDNIFSMMSMLPPNAFPVYNPDGSYGGNSLYSNPLGDILESGFFTSNSRTFQSKFQMNGDLDMITPGLSISSNLAYHSSFVSYSNKTREYERYSIATNDFDNIVYTKFGQNTQLEGDEGKSDQWQNLTFQTFLNYLKQVGSYKLDATVMYNYKNFTLIGPSEYYPEEGSVFPYQHVGVGGRFTNMLKDKYIAEFSFGYNGSGDFPEGNRFGFFPAGSLGWILSKEDFFNWDETITFLKLRGSYGIVGNDNVGRTRFIYEPTFPGSDGYYWGISNTYAGGIRPGRVANPNFTWEKEKKLNIGVEASIFDRLDVSIDYFNQKRYDILVPAYSEIPAFIGLEYPYLNVGEANNEGLEAALTVKNNPSKELNYFVKASFWYAKNEIIYNAEAPQGEPYLSKTGRSINQPFLLESIGFFKDQDDIDNSPYQVFSEVQPGDLKYKDQNDDGIINELDYYPIGKTNVPEFNLSLNSNFSYKGFYLNFLLQGVTGRSVYLDGNYYHAFQNDAKASSMALGRWIPENADNATYPRLSASNNENNFVPSTFWQKDGSFIKLRSLEIGYNLPERITGKLGMENVNVFVNGTNLFSIDRLEYTDPETLFGYPSLRTFSIGTSIQF